MVLRPLAPASAPAAPSADDGTELASLAREAAAGDDAATQRFLRAVWPTVTRVITSVLGAGHSDVEDAVQQSLIGLLRAIGLFRGECHPLGYASKIALHTALRVRRRAGLERARAQELARLDAERTPAPPPSEHAAAERRKQVLRDLLQDLPAEQAEGDAKPERLGWSLEDVALATGAPVNTVRSRVRLAKEALRRRIEQNPHLADDLRVS